MEVYEIAKLGNIVCLIISLGCMFMLAYDPETDIIKNQEQYFPIVVIGTIAELGWIYFILAELSFMLIDWFIELLIYCI